MATDDGPDPLPATNINSRSPRSMGAQTLDRSYVSPNALLMQPELWQPSIMAISLTYIAYAVAAHFELLPLRPASRQFAYVCCIVGLLAASLIYVRYLAREHYYTKLSVAMATFLTLVLSAYIVYWLVQPSQASFDQLETGYFRGFNARSSYETEQIRIFTRPPPWGTVRPFPTGPPSPQPPTTITPVLPRVPSVCHESLKCSHPLHLMLQVVYMFCVLLCLIMTLIQIFT